MTTAAPVVPPRPSRSADKDSSSGSLPKVPPRPSKKRPDRSVSPNPERFAPSPLNETILAAKNNAVGQPLLSPGIHEPLEDPIERAGSVPMPSVGEEGLEYSAVAEEIENDNEQLAQPQVTPPEHTSTVAHDLKLHAPKPSLPADSAKQRVQAVTRTDSEKAASYGIGHRAASRDGLKKKPSTNLSTGTGSDNGPAPDDEQGIPEIGQRVPMNPLLGDVQAPSSTDSEAKPKKGHVRNHSSRGLPPGSYGLHGHGVTPQDKLEKAYYEKHPEALKREHSTPIHERQNDYALTREELNKLVRDTANRGSGLDNGSEYRSTPTDEVGFQASEEYAQRITSPRPTSKDDSIKSPLGVSHPSLVLPDDHKEEHEEDDAIHVDDPKHPEYRSYGDGDIGKDEGEEYQAPILAPDEADHNSNGFLQQPAVHPPPERRGSPYEMDDAPSRPSSRPVSRHFEDSKPDVQNTALEDVEEYEPLFPEEAKRLEAEKAERADENKNHQHFPSKDIWEDAPNSVHYTATVSTPEVHDIEHHRSRSSGTRDVRPLTPAHIFAQKHEELAERESEGRPKDLNVAVSSPSEDRKSTWSQDQKPSWAERQAHIKVERPSSGPKFPSRDVWEDVPESHVYEATIASPITETKPEESKPSVPARPARKSPESSERPAVPSRPKPRQSSGDDKPRPAVSDKPKPQIPVRPAKSGSGDSKEAAASKPKPPVPSRPMGGKIAALQAGFMSDLNKRLQLGPQGPKKEEAPEPAAVEEKEKEKVPLSDARKGRARGPQRRAPAKSPAAPSAETKAETKAAAPSFGISLPLTTWSINPDVGDLLVSGTEPDKVELPHSGEADVAEVKSSPEKVAEPEVVPTTTEPVPDIKADPEPKAEIPAEQEPKLEQEAESEVKIEDKPQPKEEIEVEAEPASKELSQPETETVVEKAEEQEPEEKTIVANPAGETNPEEGVVKTKDTDVKDAVES